MILIDLLPSRINRQLTDMRLVAAVPPNIAKAVAIESDRDIRLGCDPLGADDVGKARRMNAEHDHHGVAARAA